MSSAYVFYFTKYIIEEKGENFNFLFYVFEAGSHSVAPCGQKLALYSRLSLNGVGGSSVHVLPSLVNELRNCFGPDRAELR